MYGTAVIVFREVLEAALVVSIILAATNGVAGSRRWAAIGVAAGLLGACTVAVFADAITDALAGMGQEILNATILIFAALMLGWHSIWMSSHARELVRDISEAGQAVASGSRPLWAVGVVIAAAVLREGAETVLFVMGAGTSEEASFVEGLSAGLAGAAAAVAIGAGLYAGLLRIPVKHLFSVTNAMILLLMAGMASQAAGFLVQAGLLPPLADPLWDASALLTEKSLVGKVLHALIGYQSRPAGVQVLVYGLVLAGVLILSRLSLLKPIRRSAVVPGSAEQRRSSG